MVAVTNQPGLADRLQNVRVGIRRELEISRHVLNGEPAYIIRDPVSFQTLRLTTQDYQIFVALNAEQELGAILATLTSRGIIAEDQAGQFYDFVLRLTQFGLLTLPVSDGAGLFKRFKRRQTAALRAKITGFLFMRVPLISPEKILQRTMKWFMPLFTRWAFLLWLVGMSVSSLVVSANWNEFWNPIATVQITSNLPVLWTLLVVLKVIHEFGHAYACKRFGGYVPEMGVFLIVFTPSAYIDASASWGFPKRMHRVIVALAGMYFESIIAMLALAVWCLTPHGTLHSTAQYVVLLSTAITLGFNANPLMKYDGYFVLSDLLGMPNLRADSQFALKSLLTRLVFGIEQKPSRYTATRQLMLIAYGIACALYKVAVVIGMSLMLVFMLPVLGIGLAGLYLFQTISQSVRGLIQLYHSPEAANAKGRILATVFISATAFVFCGTQIPMPMSVNGIGIVQRSEDQTIRADVSGFLGCSLVLTGDRVYPGQPMCELINPDLNLDVLRKEAEVQQLEIQLLNLISTDRPTALLYQEKLEQTQQEYQQICTKQNRLRVEVNADGVITGTDGLQFPGQFIKEGDVLATLSGGRWIVQTLVTSEDLYAAAPQVGTEVDVCLIGYPDNTCAGRVIRVARAGSRVIHDASLAHSGGGSIPVNVSTMEASQVFFEVTIAIPNATQPSLRHGMTAMVRFHRQPVSIATILYRRSLHLLSKLQKAG